MWLLAQADQSMGINIIQALAHNGLWVFCGICVLAGTLKHIAGMVLKHRERIAMIDAGLTPEEDASSVQTSELKKAR